MQFRAIKIRNTKATKFTGALCAALFLVMIPAKSFGETVETNSDDAERFQMKRDGDSFVRMNKETGEMSICDRKGSALICRMAADDRIALEDEVARLQKKVDELTKAEAGDELAQIPKLAPKSEDGRQSENGDKSSDYFDEELDKMVDYSSKVLKRFFTVMKELREDFEK